MALEPIVLDTNIVLSAAISPQGRASKAMQLAFSRYQPVYSRDTVVELAVKLNGEKMARWIDSEHRLRVLAFYLQQAALVHPVASVRGAHDPDDDAFLALAQAAGARMIVTGDKKFLALRRFGRCQLVTPAEFITLSGEI